MTQDCIWRITEYDQISHISAYLHLVAAFMGKVIYHNNHRRVEALPINSAIIHSHLKSHHGSLWAAIEPITLSKETGPY